MLLQSAIEIQNARRHNRDVDSTQCLEEIKKSIKDTYDYFDVVDTVWWEPFFMEKNEIISNSTNGNIFLKTPFHWPQSMSNENEELNVEPKGVDPSQEEEWEMYIKV